MNSAKHNEIYFFIPFYPKITTGGNKYHSIIFDYLKKENIRVKVFGSEENIEYIEKSKIKKIFYGIRKSFEIPGNSKIVLTNTAFLHFLIPLVTISRLKRHKYIIVIHHLLVDQDSKKFVKILEKIFVKLIKYKITVSDTTNKRLLELKYIKKSIPIIPPGLEFEPKLKYARENISPIHKLLFIGNIEKRKNLHILINSLKLLPGIKFNLTIIGKKIEEEYYEYIIAIINKMKLADKIDFKENLESSEIKSYYLNSDIMVFPSKWEGYGMVIAEAMAFGLPVIASNIPTSKELINDRINGILFEVGNEKELANSILELFNNNKLYNKISINSIQKVKSLKSWEETSSKFFDIINKL